MHNHERLAAALLHGRKRRRYDVNCSGVAWRRRARIPPDIEIVLSLESRLVEKPFQALQHQPLLARMGTTRPTPALIRPLAYLFSCGLEHDARFSSRQRRGERRTEQMPAAHERRPRCARIKGGLKQGRQFARPLKH